MIPDRKLLHNGSMLTLCRRLVEIAPCYGIMGNHEDEMVYLDGDEELVERFADTGVVFLRNEEETIQVGGDTVQLVGVSGNAKSFKLYGGKECMDALEPEYVGLRIVMAHIPA